jgi:hypothetical protein
MNVKYMEGMYIENTLIFLFIYSYVHTLFGPFLPPPLSLSSPPHPRFQAEPLLSFSPILLKRRNKQ